MVTLPLTPSVANYEFTTTLDGVVYGCVVHWNSRDESWYLDLLTDDAQLIRAGMRLVLGALLGIRCVDPRFPPGILRVRDTTGSGVEAGFDDMGTRVVVTYESPSELVAVST